MEDLGLVSIIMPSYNSEQYIRASIESVINQSYSNWELLIVDDCSTDETVGVINSFKDERIKLFQNKTNSGAAVSRNKALKEARGKWIAFLDSDDIWLTDKLEKQLEFMSTNNYVFSYTDYQMYQNDSTLPYIYTSPNKLNKKMIYRYCYCFTSTVMYDFSKVGLVQIPNLKKNNDYVMWIMILSNCDGYRLNESLSIYNKHSGSISSVSKFKLIKWHYLMFKEGLNRSSFVSGLFTIRNLWFGFWKKIIYRKRISFDKS